MRNSIAVQIVSLVALIAAAFFLIDPMGLQMPENVHMATLACVVIFGGIFAAFVLSEGGGDEREEMHRAFAGRIAFFLGATVLIVGITIQTFSHALDPWLVYALVVMIAGKIVARVIAATTK